MPTLRQEPGTPPSPAPERDLIEAARREAHEQGSLPVGPPPESDGERFAVPPPDSFPGYEILRGIHKGGQGVVYLAMQHATRRKVAIKVMREAPFADSRERARFEREVHILGQLKHPAIVAVHDSGTATTGRFFYVMDYIPGQPLDVYMASGERSVHRTLELFEKICAAVNAAHLRGVIHRDLKPGNIRIDPQGEPHILDFGLAKVAGADLAGASRPQPVTLTGEFIGSLPWASPEQAEGRHDALDLRTDVYSLGVMLYQVLTGRFPYEVAGNMRDVLENIVRAPPIRPGAVRRQIDNEVETIVLKCLSKEPQRRYQSAGELGRDLAHYLCGEPIEAKRDSAWYVLRKTLGRYRVPAAVGAAFVLLLAASSAALSVMYARQGGLLGQVKLERDRAVKAEAVALRQADKAEKFKSTINMVLGSIDPFKAKGRDVTVRAVLDDAAARVPELAPDPEVEAALRTTIGSAYLGLGRYDDAEPQLRAAVALARGLPGGPTTDLADALFSTGTLLWQRGDAAGSETLHREALAIRRALIPRHPKVAYSLNALALVVLDARADYDGARAFLHEAQALLDTIPDDDGVLRPCTINNMAWVERNRGDFATAEQLFRRSLGIARSRLGDEHPEVATILENIGLVLQDRGRFADAEPFHRQALAMRLKLLGDEHPHVANSLNNLGLLLQNLGDYDAAEPLYRQCIRVRRALLGSEHPHVALSLNNLAQLLSDRGDAPGALPPAEEGLGIRRRHLPANHPDLASSMATLGVILLQSGRPAEAQPLLEEALRIRRERLAPAHWLTANAASGLGACLTALGRFAEAEPLLVDSYPIIRGARGDSHKRTIDARQRLVALYQAWGKPDSAAEYQAGPDDEPRAPGR